MYYLKILKARLLSCYCILSLNSRGLGYSRESFQGQAAEDPGLLPAPVSSPNSLAPRPQTDTLGPLIQASIFGACLLSTRPQVPWISFHLWLFYPVLVAQRPSHHHCPCPRTPKALRLAVGLAQLWVQVCVLCTSSQPFVLSAVKEQPRSEVKAGSGKSGAGGHPSP